MEQVIKGNGTHKMNYKCDACVTFKSLWGQIEV